MKTTTRFLFRSLLAAMLLVPAFLKAQTTLIAGDLLFTSYNSNTGISALDSFSFVLLKQITNGTRINFSDRGYIFNGTTGSYQTTSSLEGSASWVSSGTLAVGTEVLITNNTALVNGVVNGTVSVIDGTTGGSNTTGYSLTGNDQIFAYQNTSAPFTLTTGSTLISGIHWNRCVSGSTVVTTDGGWDAFATCNTSASASQLPASLTAGFSSLWVGEVTGGFVAQEGSFNCTGVPSTDLNTIRSNVYNKANWIKNNAITGAPPTPSGCNFFGTPLPVSWASFAGTCRNENVSLNWTVFGEHNISGYEVQRSEDGAAFQTIGTQKALGETGTRSYQYIDYRPGSAPAYYYRLKSMELSGAPQFSTTVRIANMSDGANSGFRLLRNPAGTSLELEIAAVKDGTARLVVTDLVGRAVLQQEWPVRAGYQAVSCPTTGMAPDQIYVLTGYMDGKIWKARVIR